MNQTEIVSIAPSAVATVALLISLWSLQYSRAQATAAQASNNIALRTERRAIFDRVRSLIQDCEEARLRSARAPTDLQERLSDLATDLELAFGSKLVENILEIFGVTRSLEQAYDYRNHGIEDDPQKYKEALADEAELEQELVSKLRSLTIQMKPDISSSVA